MRLAFDLIEEITDKRLFLLWCQPLTRVMKRYAPYHHPEILPNSVLIIKILLRHLSLPGPSGRQSN